jgi:hypothetical protein
MDSIFTNMRKKSHGKKSVPMHRDGRPGNCIALKCG